MADLLVMATAGLKPDQLADSEHLIYPRTDYIELKRLLDLDVMNYAVYGHTPLGRFWRALDTQLHADFYLTLLGLVAQRRYGLTFAMSERVGTPLALLRPRTPARRLFVAMFQCWSWRQEAVISVFRLLRRMDAIIVHCQSMKDHLLAMGATNAQVHVIHYSVDQRFFTPRRDVAQEEAFVLSLGEIRSRDYATLFQAAEGLPMRLLVAASGSWYAREVRPTLHSTVPDNTVLSGRFSQLELRDLYARASFVVLPVLCSVFSAGATALLEAMCMERAVIATRSPGLQEYLIDGETGIFVEPANPQALQEAIRYLLAHPEEARRMGQNARQRVEAELNLDRYVERIAQLLQATSQGRLPAEK